MKWMFSWVLSQSIQGVWLILLALLVRAGLKKGPALFRYVLWVLVFVGLLCPWRVETAWAPREAVTLVLMQPKEGVPARENEAGPEIPPAPATEQTAYVLPQEPAANEKWGVLWALGAAGLLAWGLWNGWRWKQNLQGAKETAPGIWEVEGLPTAFVFGLRPGIYLPAHLPLQERQYILLHEQIHLRRKDHWVKAACYGVLCLFWFHPLVWLAYHLLEADMEQACDEAVLHQMGDEVKKSYSASLLRMAARESGLPLGFGEKAVKRRLAAVLRYQKPKAAVVVFSAVLVALAGWGIFSRGPETVEEQIVRQVQTQSEDFASAYGVTIQSFQADTVQLAVFPDLYTGVEVWQATPQFTIDTQAQLSVPDPWVQEGNRMSRQSSYFVYETKSRDYLGEIWAVAWTGTYSDLETNVRALLEQEGLLEQETYPGPHQMATFTLSDGQSAQMLLSQPVRQDETGIWCVERWIDSQGHLYYEGPQVEETAKDYYLSLQQACDEGHRVGLLDPEDVARTFLAEHWGHGATFTGLQQEVTLEQFMTVPVSTYFVKVVDVAEDGTLQVQQGTPHWEGEALSRTVEAAEQNLTVDWWDVWGSKKTPGEEMQVLLLQEEQTAVAPDTENQWMSYLKDALKEGNTPCFWLWERKGVVIRLEEQFVPQEQKKGLEEASKSG